MNMTSYSEELPVLSYLFSTSCVFYSYCFKDHWIKFAKLYFGCSVADILDWLCNLRLPYTIV